MKNLIKEIKQLDTKGLKNLWSDYKRTAELSKNMQELIADELRFRHGEAVRNELTERNREHGEVTIVSDNESVKFEIRQTVKWDSEKLKAIAADIPASVRDSILKIELSIPEKAYAGLSGELRLRVDEARSVTYSEPKVSFQEKQSKGNI